MAINVPPVVGKTPIQVATELRSLIRDGIWFKAKQVSGEAKAPKTATSVLTNKQYIEASLRGQADYLSEAEELLTLLSKEATLRKPSLIRNRVDQIRGNLQAARNRRADALAYAARLIPPDPHPANPSAAIKELLAMCERAYALVQALPTIESPAVGREANTIRAITAILKVHYGLEVQGTVENLPEMMPLLLEAIKKPAEPELVLPEGGFDVMKFDPKYGYKLTQEPVLPWQILSKMNNPLGNYVFKSLMGDIALTKYGSKPPGVPPTSTGKFWNGGNCSPLDALKALLALRFNYVDTHFTLRDSNGIVFAMAPKNEKLDLRYGFGDVLYHLRKEYKENAKSQATPPLDFGSLVTATSSNAVNFTSINTG